MDGGGRGPTLLSRGDKSGPARMPGSIAIMQRASSGGNMAVTSPLKSNTSSGIYAIYIQSIMDTLAFREVAHFWRQKCACIASI